MHDNFWTLQLFGLVMVEVSEWNIFKKSTMQLNIYWISVVQTVFISLFQFSKPLHANVQSWYTLYNTIFERSIFGVEGHINFTPPPCIESNALHDTVCVWGGIVLVVCLYTLLIIHVFKCFVGKANIISYVEHQPITKQMRLKYSFQPRQKKKFTNTLCTDTYTSKTWFRDVIRIYRKSNINIPKTKHHGEFVFWHISNRKM